ncbi:MAG: hypothetical protein O7J95_18835 [Planctomycetota bacterium]|nr:hypothetical protein [Planctomycetota bacterium]
MPTPTGSNEEIIEKRDSSPVATSCLVIAVLALIGAVVFHLYEIGELTANLDAGEVAALLEGDDIPLDDRLARIERAVDAAIKDADTKVDRAQVSRYRFASIGQKGAAGSRWEEYQSQGPDGLRNFPASPAGDDDDDVGDDDDDV